jgi:hypothetical protein
MYCALSLQLYDRFMLWSLEEAATATYSCLVGVVTLLTTTTPIKIPLIACRGLTMALNLSPGKTTVITSSCSRLTYEIRHRFAFCLPLEIRRRYRNFVRVFTRKFWYDEKGNSTLQNWAILHNIPFVSGTRCLWLHRPANSIVHTRSWMSIAIVLPFGSIRT